MSRLVLGRPDRLAANRATGGCVCECEYEVMVWEWID